MPRQTRERAALRAGFSLIELLTVIGIISLVVAMAIPTLRSFSHNVMTAANSQMLAAIERARGLAISQRSTVYMVFVPIGSTTLPEKQLTGFAYVSVRSPGDQPGRTTLRYLSSWKSLPDGSYICPQKFQPYIPSAPTLFIPTNSSGGGYSVYGFPTNSLPFPTETSQSVGLPCIGFNYLGQLVSGHDETIPLVQGSVSPGPPLLYSEQPRGNTTNSFNIIRIDWLTGRSRVERKEVER
jgi:prepilin-type N-terminal cleavage/methylation domain-containing protein